jgi:hypothetical protein
MTLWRCVRLSRIGPACSHIAACSMANLLKLLLFIVWKHAPCPVNCISIATRTSIGINNETYKLFDSRKVGSERYAVLCRSPPGATISVTTILVSWLNWSHRSRFLMSNSCPPSFTSQVELLTTSYKSRTLHQQHHCDRPTPALPT